jgi:hypothetical protein
MEVRYQFKYTHQIFNLMKIFSLIIQDLIHCIMEVMFILTILLHQLDGVKKIPEIK